MASETCIKQSLSKDDVRPIYKPLLDDIDKCFTLFDELKKGKTKSQRFIDWTFGERNSINIGRMQYCLKKLEEVVKEGIGLYDQVFEVVEQAEQLINVYKEKVKLSELQKFDNSPLKSCLNSSIESLNSDFDYLAESFKKLKAQLSADKQGHKLSLNNSEKEQQVESQAKPLGMTGVSASPICGLSNITIINSIGQERGLEYRKLKNLSETVQGETVLAFFQCSHISIQVVLSSLRTHINSLKYFDTIWENISNTQTLAKSEVTHDDIKTAKEMYSEVLAEEFQELTSTEPDMSEEIKKRTATRAAVRNCKTFLKETLKLSDGEADQLIREIQDS